MHSEESHIARREIPFLLKKDNSRSTKWQFTGRNSISQNAIRFFSRRKIDFKQAKWQNFRSKIVSRSAKGRS